MSSVVLPVFAQTSTSAPTGLKAQCNAAGNQVTLSWNAVSGANYYLIRVNDLSNDGNAAQWGWYVPGTTDLIDNNVSQNTYTATIIPGKNYTWWIHSQVGSNASEANSGSFICSPQQVDILTYFLRNDFVSYPNNSLYQYSPTQFNLVDNLGNNIQFNQFVRGNNIFLEKWRDPTQRLHYTYDDNYIYLKYDSTGLYPYSFSDGRWLKKIMNVGDRIDVNSNNLKYYTDLTSCNVKSSGAWPYYIVLADLNRDTLPGIGTVDVIIVEYHWENMIEKEYYAKNWGIYKWEEYDSNGNLVRYASLKNVSSTSSNPPPLPADPCEYSFLSTLTPTSTTTSTLATTPTYSSSLISTSSLVSTTTLTSAPISMPVSASTSTSNLKSFTQTPSIFVPPTVLPSTTTPIKISTSTQPLISTSTLIFTPLNCSQYSSSKDKLMCNYFNTLLQLYNLLIKLLQAKISN